MAKLRVNNRKKTASMLPCRQEAAALIAQLVSGLEKVGLAMKSRTWRREGRAGLGPLQRQVLTLLRTKPGQRARISTVANELAVRLPTASEVIATLEEKQLVRRRRDLSDGRVVLAQLTAKGNRSCTPSPDAPDRLGAATATLSSPEQVVLLTSLVKVIHSLQTQGEIAVARMCVSCQDFRPNQHANAERPHHCDSANASFGNCALRLDCKEYKQAPVAQANEAWANFTGSGTA